MAEALGNFFGSIVNTTKDAYHKYVHPHFRKPVYKSNLGLARNRLDLRRNQYRNRILSLRKVIFSLLTEEKNLEARYKCEELLVIEDQIAAIELIQPNIVNAVARVDFIDRFDAAANANTPPRDMQTSLANLVYASRLQVEELGKVREELGYKFGAAYISSVEDKRVGVTPRLVELLDESLARQVPRVVDKLQSISSEGNLLFTAPSEWYDEVLPAEPEPEPEPAPEPTPEPVAEDTTTTTTITAAPPHTHPAAGTAPASDGSTCTRPHLDDQGEMPPPPPPPATGDATLPPPPQPADTMPVPMDTTAVERDLAALPSPPQQIPPGASSSDSSAPPPPPPPVAPVNGSAGSAPPPPPPPAASTAPTPPPPPPAAPVAPPPPAAPVAPPPPPPPPLGGVVEVDVSPAPKDTGDDRSALLNAIRRFSKDELSRPDPAALTPEKASPDVDSKTSPTLLNPQNDMITKLEERRAAMGDDDDVSSHDGEGCSDPEWD
eukprot:TRINITY_DN23425_c0_g1_i1.p1 TRINITY_DN23425_c0_g1~~TRINITY_DN23425_c0_g1_i1.p1  ORF type:complete len:492 (-),score=117.50 TRINITY_DN23425_c0_g1_i1:80-1555(-)